MNDSTSLVRSVYTAFQRGDIQSILNVLSAGIDWKYYGQKEIRAKIINTWREKFGHKARTQ